MNSFKKKKNKCFYIQSYNSLKLLLSLHLFHLFNKSSPEVTQWWIFWSTKPLMTACNWCMWAAALLIQATTLFPLLFSSLNNPLVKKHASSSRSVVPKCFGRSGELLWFGRSWRASPVHRHNSPKPTHSTRSPVSAYLHQKQQQNKHVISLHYVW